MRTLRVHDSASVAVDFLFVGDGHRLYTTPALRLVTVELGIPLVEAEPHILYSCRPVCVVLCAAFGAVCGLRLMGMPCTQCARSAQFWMSANTRTLATFWW